MFFYLYSFCSKKIRCVLG